MLESVDREMLLFAHLPLLAVILIPPLRSVSIQ